MTVKVLMVCLGNICRSPLAEGILKSKVNSTHIFVDSAGTSAYHAGNLPDERSIEVAAKYGIDLRQQRSRKFVIEDFDIFDYIFVMDQSNYDNIVSLARNQKDIAKVDFILNQNAPDQNAEVPDPYYGGELGFEKVYSMLDNACNVLSQKL